MIPWNVWSVTFLEALEARLTKILLTSNEISFCFTVDAFSEKEQTACVFFETQGNCQLYKIVLLVVLFYSRSVRA